MGQLASVDYDQIAWPVGIKSGCKGFFKVLFAGAVRHVPCVLVQEALAKWKSKIARGPQEGNGFPDFPTGKCAGTGAVCSLRLCLCEVPAARGQTICKKH